jgi:serine phosphatase RsbU (regulator of sigma subunit)
MRSALVTAILRGLVNECRACAAEPGLFLTRINSALLEALQACGTPIFATAFYLVLDTETGCLRYASAGHPGPLVLRRAAGRVESLRGRCGAALGLFRDTDLTTQEAALAVGDGLLFFTDGLYEVPGPDGEPFGRERLVAAVRQRLTLPAAQLLAELIAAARQFTRSGEFEDDVCLVTTEFVRRVARPNRNVQPHENAPR